MREVLTMLRQNKMYGQLPKSFFNKSEIHFLGHVVNSAEGLHVDPRKTEVVEKWPTPTNVRDVRSFLGMANYFRKFVENFSQMVRPLTMLTRKDVEFVWSEDCEKAFRGAIQALVTAPILALPNFSKPFEVQCDASITGLGAVLLQEGRAVAYESRALKPAEVNYGTPEQELLAVVNALATWRCYLEGVEFKVVTDHNPLVFFQTQATLSRRQARWQLFLSRFRYT